MTQATYKVAIVKAVAQAFHCYSATQLSSSHSFWKRNELLQRVSLIFNLKLEEKQSKYRSLYLFRNTLLSPSSDCCNVSDVLIYYLQVALMQHLRIYY